MTTRAVAITGANGFIGSALAARFIERSWRVIGLARTAPERADANIIWRTFDLADRDISPDFLRDADVLIHAAMQAPRGDDDAIETNLQGTKKLLECARACDVRGRIFLSSFAARGDARSAYGKQKHAVEALFSDPADAIVRPGLVIGSGGLFGRIAEELRKRRIVPLVDGGMQPLQTIYLDDLCSAIERIVAQDMRGVFNLAEPVAISYKAFHAELCARLSVAPFFVPIPYALARLALAAGSALGVSMPISPDTLLGLKALQHRETKADIARLGIPVRSARESFDALFRSTPTEAPA